MGSRIVGAREASNASGYLSFYTSPDASGSVPLERMRIKSTGEIQARRPRSNTDGEVALSLQPTDSTINYGFRIDQTNNAFNLDRVDSALNLLNVTAAGNATFAGTGTFEGGGNTLTLKKGTGTAALAFVGTATDPQASALIEGVAGGGLKIYTSNGGTVGTPGWSPKLTIAAGGNATFTGTVKAATTFIADATDPGNPTPAEDNLRVSGYGIIGKRGAVYVTNAGTSSTDSVQIGIGGVHASNTKIHVNPSNSIFFTNIQAGADSTYDIGTSATRFANVYADTLYGDGSNLTGVTVSNADTVDNLHAASFLRSDADDTATGAVTFTGVTTIGPGTTGTPYDATTFLHVKGTTRSIVQQSSTADAYYMFGDAAANNVAWVGYNHSTNQLSLHTGGTTSIDGLSLIHISEPTRPY